MRYSRPAAFVLAWIGSCSQQHSPSRPYKWVIEWLEDQVADPWLVTLWAIAIGISVGLVLHVRLGRAEFGL